jgi:SAM-dependent methyltransferase
MSFSADWLALREPADHDALNPDVRAALSRCFERKDHVNVVDLGCGAGSNLRGLYAALPRWQSWTLVDYDPLLLTAARSRLQDWADNSQTEGDKLILFKGDTRIGVTFRQADLAQGNFGPVTEGADLVTAAALFDLVSVPVIEKLADSVSRRKQVFMTVLTYDGLASWHPPQKTDAQMVAAFNAHQRGDKGFGPAAGAGGTSALSKAFQSAGYRILRGSSPWRVNAKYGGLRLALDEGFAGAVRETGKVQASDIDNWLAGRRAAKDGLTQIGHEDILAVPV